MLRRHPSGDFVRGDSSRLQFIRPHSRSSTSRSSSLPSQSTSSQPLRPIAIAPSRLPPLSPRASVSSQSQQPRRVYSTSEPYRDTRGDPPYGAVSSPMIRSVGSSTFSSSSRSWSPITPTTQFPSPTIDGYFQFSPTFPTVDTVPLNYTEEPCFATWLRDNRDQTEAPVLDSSLDPSGSHTSAIGGLAGLSFDEYQPSLSGLQMQPPTRTPLFVLPSHCQHSTSTPEHPHAPQAPASHSFAPPYPLPSRPFVLQQPPPPPLYYPSVLQPPTISVFATSVTPTSATPFDTPVVQRKEKRSTTNRPQIASSTLSSQLGHNTSQSRSTTSSLALLASAAQQAPLLSRSTSSAFNARGRNRGKPSRSPNAYNPYRVQSEANKLTEDSNSVQHLSVPRSASADLVRSKSVGSTPRHGRSLALPSIRGLVGPASSFSTNLSLPIADSRASYWSLGDHYLTNPILRTTQRPTSSVRDSPRPVPSTRLTQSAHDFEMST